MTLTITLPLPPKELSPNGRSHFHAKAKAVKNRRTAAMVCALSQLPVTYKPRHQAATVQIDRYGKTAMHPDPDNTLAAEKSAIDGIVSSGFLADDRSITHLPPRFFKDPQNPRVVITVTV